MSLIFILFSLSWNSHPPDWSIKDEISKGHMDQVLSTFSSLLCSQCPAQDSSGRAQPQARCKNRAVGKSIPLTEQTAGRAWAPTLKHWRVLLRVRGERLFPLTLPTTPALPGWPTSPAPFFFKVWKGREGRCFTWTTPVMGFGRGQVETHLGIFTCRKAGFRKPTA